uniref:Uncharacterized protein n=1 Tax=Setaria italica TaxID=4555 RepID=K4AHN0_SETIT
MAIEELLRGRLELESVAMKETKGKKENTGKQELKTEDLVRHIRCLVGIGQQIVVLQKCILVVCVWILME